MKILRLPLPYYGPEDETGADDGKSPAQRERDKIKVTSTTTKEADEKEVEEEKEEKDDAQDNVDEEAEKESEEEKEEDEKEDEEEKELTAEQKEIQALTKKLERAQRRAGKTAAERDENKKLVRELKAQLEAKLADGEQPLTEEEVNRRARELADNDLSQREFNKAQEKLIDEATKIDKNFMSKINELAAEVAPLPQFFIGALNDVDNGGEVLNYLTDNPDEYEDILKKNSPMKVMKGLLEISNKLIDAKKVKPKKVSNAPEPAKAPNGNRRSPDTLPPNPTKDMEEFIRVRNLQEKARREARNR